MQHAQHTKHPGQPYTFLIHNHPESVSWSYAALSLWALREESSSVYIFYNKFLSC